MMGLSLMDDTLPVLKQNNAIWRLQKMICMAAGRHALLRPLHKCLPMHLVPLHCSRLKTGDVKAMVS